MLTHSLWWLVCDALAVYRLAQLVGSDTITQPIRDASSERMTLFLTCPWCVSIWIAAAVVALTALVPSAWQYAALALALSGVTGFLAER
jgi:Protein of unknown function (DUF1360)